jgi:hypothetical protein
VAVGWHFLDVREMSDGDGMEKVYGGLRKWGRGGEKVT